MIPGMSLYLNQIKNFDNLKNKKIGSSSIRRELQIKLIYPGVKINDIRGNIETRISKVDNQSMMELF